MKKSLSLVLSLIMIISALTALPFSASAIADPACGENVYYRFNSETGLLEIYGNGNMENYELGESPFFRLSNAIKQVNIESGVTSIGSFAFRAVKLELITIPTSVSKIGESAFNKCENLETVMYPGNQNTWNQIDIKGNNEPLWKLMPQTFDYDVYTITYDFNGGTRNGETEYTVHEGASALSVCTENFIDLLEVTPPSRKELAAVEINGVRRQFDYTYEQDQDTTYKYLWKNEGAPAEVDTVTGVCGDNITFSLDTNTGELLISGYGSMDNYEIDDSPFSSYASLIKSVFISNDITSIGDFAFRGAAITSVRIPKSVKSIGESAFMRCNKLTAVNYPGTNSEWNAIDIEGNNEPLWTLKPQTFDEPTYRVTYDLNGGRRNGETEYTEHVPAVMLSIVPENFIPLIEVTPPYGLDLVAVEANGVRYNMNGNLFYLNQDTTFRYIWGYHTHNFKEVVAIKKATLTSNGYIEKECICGETGKTAIYSPKTFTLSSTSFTYDGKNKKPGVTVKDSAGKKIAASNFSVSYSGGTSQVGRHCATVTFKGSYYRGTKKLYYNVNPKGTKLSKVSSQKSKQITATWKKQTSQTHGYQIQISTNKNFTANKKTVTINSVGTTSKTISNLKSKTKYYVRVRTFKVVSGSKYYSTWSNARDVVTKK